MPRFSSGQSGNPGGRPKLPPEIRAARKRDMAMLIALIAKHFGMTKKQAKARAPKPEVTQLETAVAKLVSRSMSGDVNAFRYLVELMVGKIPENDFDEFTEDELILLDQIKQAMAKKEADATESAH